MFSYRNLLVILASAAATVALAQSARIQGVGRTATANEIKAWDIDVRPDFKGLPAGQGSVSQGEKVWEAQCASCHGSFGENNSVFSPLVGYTNKKDVETGRVASLLAESNTPGRTTLMKVSQLSTLWDYINRAMPWTAPKSLSPNDVYAVTAYLLNLGNVVPDDFTLSDKNMADVQKKLPNRNGMTTAHAMWPGKEFGGTTKPDVQGSACMTNCNTDPKVASFLPEHVRNAHGNLAEQSREFGALRGADTTKPASAAGKAPTSAPAATEPAKSIAVSAVATPSKAVDKAPEAPVKLKSSDVSAILSKNSCSACHGVDNRIVGPSFKEIAAKHSAKSDALAYLAGKIKSGGSGVYGAIPMPPQTIGDADAKKVAQWISQGAAK
jgi:S-disulfanyl-L-cysteine oxidoreductase SoxD